MSDSGDTPATATVIVRGEATVEADPEIVVFAVSVRARARDRREAMENLAQRSAEFTTLVESFGAAIEKVETSGISVYPELRRGRDEKVRWYRGTVRSRLTVADLSMAGELVSKLSDLELCLIEGPWWELRPGSTVYRDARTQAARAAVARAAEYAEAVGGQLLSLIELADTGLTAPQRQLRYAANQAMASAEPAEQTPVVIDLEPETQTVTATVEARFTMTQPPSLG